MNIEDIGKRISELRKKSGMTQMALAQMLDVSDRTVSKWETGQGYPDITIFPKLSALFGVSIDYLLVGPKKGITIAGTIVADVVKYIQEYPKYEMMTYVSGTSPAVGGCAPNTAINLAKIDSSIPISILGKVGGDAHGRFILAQLQKNGIDVSKVAHSSEAATSCCDVMHVPTGERTFFYEKGANAEFCPADIDIRSLDCNLLHIGYVLLLDQFDRDDDKYGTVMARFLHDVQKQGVQTSIDIASNVSADYGKKVLPALRYCNYVIVNETICCRIWRLDARTPAGLLNKQNVKEAMARMAEAGVKNKVAVHSKEASFILDVQSRVYTEVPALNIPKEEIKGSVGDSFCSGYLYGIYNHFSDRQILEFASSAAACSLLAADTANSMRTKLEIEKLADQYGRLSE